MPEVMVIDSVRVLEKTGEMRHRPRFSSTPCEFRHAHEIQHEGRREGRIATLPRELQRHCRSEKALELDPYFELTQNNLRWARNALNLGSGNVEHE